MPIMKHTNPKFNHKFTAMKHLLLTLVLLPIVACSQTNDNTMKSIVSKYKFPTHYTTVDGVEIAYVAEGKGDKTLLFVHGLSSNLDAWSKNVAILKNDFKCVALDLPGYGKSGKPEEASYTPTYFSNIISGFIDTLQLKNVLLIGHSMGGQAVIKTAVNKPEKIEKLILVAPAGIETFTDAQGNIMKTMFTPDFVANTTNEQIKTNYALNFYNQPAEVNDMITDRIAIKEAADFEAHCHAISKSIAGMLDDTVVEDLKNISQNTLILYGKNDMLIPNRYFNPGLNVDEVGNKAKENIKSSVLVFVDESGHFLQFEQPDKVNALIKEFVEKE